MNKKAETDWFGLIIIAIMLIGGVLVCYYIITKDIASCTKDPIKYAFKDSEFDFARSSFAYVELRIYQEEYDQIPIFSKKISSN